MEYRTIEGYSNYEISEFGDVRNAITGKARASWLDRDGYLTIRLTPDGARKSQNKFVHRLVYRSFKGVIPPQLTIDHIDRNKLNNHHSNLQLMTNADNVRKEHRAKFNTDEYGTYWDATREKYCCRIAINGVRVHLGYFSDIQAAHDKYQEAEVIKQYLKPILVRAKNST